MSESAFDPPENLGTTENLSKWNEAFVAAQAAMPTPTKDGRAEIQTKTGGKFSYTYLTLDRMLEAVKPALNANGLAVLQPVVLSADGRPRIQTIIIHISGEQRSWQMPILVAQGASPQEFGSALTYAKRYHLGGILGVAIEEDSDGAQLAAPAPAGGTASGAPVAEPQIASQQQHAKLHAELHDLEELHPTPEGTPTWEDETRRWTLEVKGKRSRKELTKDEMSELIKVVQDWALPFRQATAEPEPGPQEEQT